MEMEQFTFEWSIGHWKTKGGNKKKFLDLPDSLAHRKSKVKRKVYSHVSLKNQRNFK
jgi:hypothetical protein